MGFGSFFRKVKHGVHKIGHAVVKSTRKVTHAISKGSRKVVNFVKKHKKIFEVAAEIGAGAVAAYAGGDPIEAGQAAKNIFDTAISAGDSFTRIAEGIDATVHQDTLKGAFQEGLTNIGKTRKRIAELKEAKTKLKEATGGFKRARTTAPKYKLPSRMTMLSDSLNKLGGKKDGMSNIINQGMPRAMASQVLEAGDGAQL